MLRVYLIKHVPKRVSRACDPSSGTRAADYYEAKYLENIYVFKGTIVYGGRKVCNVH